jgi:hypothetical protein
VRTPLVVWIACAAWAVAFPVGVLVLGELLRLR